MLENYSGWLQYWPYAILMIVIASWALYHFLAPTSWRDWAGAGLVQAFIIALYAEMYGFPLTIYFLTSVLPLDIPLVHYSGHLWATLLGYGRVGAVIEMTIGYVFVVTGLIMIMKGWVKVFLQTGNCSLTESTVSCDTHNIRGFSLPSSANWCTGRPSRLWRSPPSSS